ncbi:MAG TPA: glycine dehydrogenase (aminomethyl-transferring), partial [Cyanobacteria bacterium UBA8156]|nr:glycine dehydrogenase (aminomethyl-transferring) [Cyanobacteria bacterium UBA8156]
MGQSVLGEGAVLSGLEQELLQEPLGFARRHLGPNMDEITAMLQVLGCATLEDLIDKTVPVGLRQREPLRLPAGRSEAEVLQLLRDMAAENQVYRSYIGMGYSACHTPAVIQRNILENPGWYTGYTPYQAEIAQGRLEMLLNFQTLVCELTGLPVANASLLDEGTALAEAIALARAVGDRTRTQVWLDAGCHPQTLAVVRTRLEPLDLVPCVGDGQSWDFTGDKPVAIALPYPNTYGALPDWQPVIQRAKAAGVLVIAVTDLLALTLWEPPGDWGADIAVGSAQRLGVPMGYGGPHAAFLAAREEFRRQLPGRIVGVSKDRTGQPALRLALQTREQHIRREKATSNICTAQVLLAVMAAAYAIYHGPEGLRTIAQKMRQHTYQLAIALQHQGWTVSAPPYFDTFTVELPAGVSLDAIRERSHQQRLNLREIDGHTLGIALDETTTAQDLADIYEVLTGEGPPAWPAVPEFPGDRPLTYLPQPVFRQHRAEADFLRYLRRLERKDFTLGEGMMPLGSCTMKLNATAELLPVSWPEFMHLHPFAPAAQTQGYQRLIQELENWLAEITGFAAISLQPNAGAQGEYAGLLAIRGYHRHRGESHRNVCLIPQSAHGTNPASAVMAGMKVVPVACDRQGNIDVADLTAKAEQYRDTLAALMITYPSTHGVFEAAIAEVCAIVKERGGRVYVDGANTNALVGLCRVADFGADVCHLNLH